MGTVKVGFILQPNFSLVAFTGALDALVTANLVSPEPVFAYQTYGLSSAVTMSDVGIEIAANGTLKSLETDFSSFDVLIVCGGLRCSLTEYSPLSHILKLFDKQGGLLGGLWNGAVALAHANLLSQQECAIHPDNHALMKEQFPQVSVSKNTLVVTQHRATCTGPASALEMMLKLIARYRGAEIVRAIREILSCDITSADQDAIPLQMADDPTLPEPLREVLELMRKNIEEPLTLVELAEHSQVSRRQMERLFHAHLDSSPSRYYLELRLRHAKRLLAQTNESITNVAIACGFVSISHFNNCFKDSFGMTPGASRARSVAGKIAAEP